jgi:NAD-dependent DNA ligase
MQDKKNIVNTSGNPDYAVAFKMPTEGNEVRAKVIAVEWAASKHGYLKPRCKIEPVRLAGVTVTYATCHNAAFVRDNGVGPGAEIILVRSGDVIPYITKVVKKVKPSLPSVKEFGDWGWNATDVDIVLVNAQDNDNVKIKQINHFFRTLEVENFSEGLVARFYEHGYDTIEKILEMRKKDMLSIDGIQARMADKIFNNIHEVIDNEVYLPSLMDASGLFGRNFGTKRFIPILDEYYPKILKWEKLATRNRSYVS